MPTYRVTGPDGATYSVTPPEGTNPSEDEILARVRGQAGGGAPAEPAPDTRSAFGKWYGERIAKPVTASTAKILAAPGEAALSVPGVPKALGWLLNIDQPGLESPEAAAGGLQAAQKAAEGPASLLVPQTPLQVGAAVGTAGAGPLIGAAAKAGVPLVGKVAPWFARLLGGAAGGEVGNLAEGGTPGVGVAIGGSGAAVGEAALGPGGKLFRGLPWMKAKIGRDYAADVGRTVGAISAPLAGARTATDLQQLAAGSGEKALGVVKGTANREIAQGIGAREGLLEIPSLGQTVKVPTAMNPVYPGPQPVTVPQSVTKPMTLQEANDALSEIGARAFSKNPLDRTFNGVDQRRLYGQVSEEIKAALDKADPTGYSAAQFTKAQAGHEKGVALLKLFEKAPAYSRYSTRMELNRPWLEQTIANPREQARLVNKLGQSDFDRFADSILQGGQLGRKSEIAWGSGRPGDALRMLGEMKGGTGAVLGATPKAVLPNLGSRYVGRTPYAASPQARTAMDLILEQAFARGAEE